MTIFEMSAGGAVIIAVVLLLRRFLLHHLPKWTFLLLWGVALFRLLVPFTLPSRFSVYTGTAQIVQAIRGAETPTAQPAEIPLPIPQSDVPALFPGADWTAEPVTPAAALPEAVSPIMVIYLSGVSLCALVFAAAYWHGLRRFRKALPAEQDFVLRWKQEHPTLLPIQVKTCAAVKTPLAHGLLRPVVLLPENTDWEDEGQLTYVLAHEYVHLCRGDLFWKVLLAAAVCLHWFNPLVWVMYLRANRDLELACDEAVVHILGLDSRKGYACALLTVAEGGFSPFCTTCATKNHMEERITAIMKLKKTSAAALLAAVLLVVGVAAVFATSQTSPPQNSPAKVEIWVDYYHNHNGMPRSKQLELDEFPGVEFTWTPGAVTAKTAQGETTLFGGMPIWNVFLCDLTGDGLPELCATVSFGSGMIDEHILVCDFTAVGQDSRQAGDDDTAVFLGGAQYALWDRGEYDYVLSLEEERLMVTKSEYLGPAVSTGTLAINGDGQLCMADEQPVAATDVEKKPLSTQDAPAGPDQPAENSTAGTATPAGPDAAPAPALDPAEPVAEPAADTTSAPQEASPKSEVLFPDAMTPNPADFWGFPEGPIPAGVEYFFHNEEEYRKMIQQLRIKGYSGWFDCGFYPDGKCSVVLNDDYDGVQRTLGIPEGITADWTYPVNSKGETYGNFFGHSILGYHPDLIGAMATNGQAGYMEYAESARQLWRGEELDGDYAEFWKAQPEVRNIPVYDVEHDTIIGYFQQHNPYSADYVTPPEMIASVIETIEAHMRELNYSEEEIAQAVAQYKAERGWD